MMPTTSKPTIPTFGTGPFCDRCKRTHALCDRSPCAKVRETAAILAEHDKRYATRTWADWIDRSLRDLRELSDGDQASLDVVHVITTHGVPAVVATLWGNDDVLATFTNLRHMLLPNP